MFTRAARLFLCLLSSSSLSIPFLRTLLSFVRRLRKIPVGSVPVAGGFYSKCHAVAVDSFGTTRLAYSFYFPRCGSFTHFPVHVSRRGVLVAAAPPPEAPLRVVADVAAAMKDASSWSYVSSAGSDDEVGGREYAGRATREMRGDVGTARAHRMWA